MSPKQKLKRYLTENTLKSTKQRERILEIFISEGRHLTSEEVLEAVQKQLPSVGLATIYRTMKLFVSAGIAHERRFADGLLRYEPAIEGEHHDHIICLDCNSIVEFEDDTIEDRQHSIAQNYGFKLVSHRLDLYTRCLNKDNCPRAKM